MAQERLSISDVLVARKRITGFVTNTPLRKSHWMSDVSTAEVWMKLENLQVTGSFKYRGALNAMTFAKERGLTKVFTASAGNHALGMAEAARTTERETTICLPTNVSPIKKAKLEMFSVGITQHGDDMELTEQYAARLAQEKKGLYISPYNNREVIAGQGTVGLEMYELVPKLSTIVVAVGGGGLISGIGLVAKVINPKVRIVGVVPAASPSMRTAVQSGHVVRVMQHDTIADGIAGNIDPETITFPLVQEVVDEWVTVEERDIRQAVFDFLEHEGMLIEGAAACAIAAISSKYVEFKPRERVGVVVCGGNIDRSTWREIVGEQLLSAGKA
ncbi:MAG: pyridoxal-phosphate dependent enzyme [Candidatus Obscuribacterales bacterium]|uniref:Pyridoxal-phosphate dependent enzyme n=1 Tax=Candidatus Obscuribacter phosphatis TaxID=1906157 RepID=A0A8J7TJY0_9BACT|nr:pyridoxal-phosphate dependent enzyme [Candidatus Obscuribacter phosphatis]MBX9939080.1 pyridoxal-phosphate dependent enzyme [Candidatus Obscuribacterales bacterium]